MAGNALYQEVTSNNKYSEMTLAGSVTSPEKLAQKRSIGTAGGFVGRKKGDSQGERYHFLDCHGILRFDVHCQVGREHFNEIFRKRGIETNNAAQ